MRLRYEGASLNISDYGDRFYITSLLTSKEHRRKNYAKKLLRICKRYADKKKKPLELNAFAFDDKPLSNELLISFYEKMGFRRGKYANVLVYQPKEK